MPTPESPDDRIDSLCVAFEAEWLAGREPALEFFLTLGQAMDAQVLFHELLKVELHHRQAAGQPLSPQDYIRRFPQFRLLIEQYWQQNRLGTGSTRPFTAAFNRSANERLDSGTLFAERYQVICRLGEGGMSTVYRCRDTVSQDEVAIKLLSVDITGNQTRLESLRRELNTARSVTHENVCRVHYLGEGPDSAFIEMEYVRGETLQQLLAKAGPISPRRGLAIARQLCAGLAEAHRRGVIHRDLKPANIMVDDAGNVKVMDFGLALPAQDAGQEGQVAGTLPYMAPEQLHGQGVDQRSDIYALGLILYEMFSGTRVFRGTSLTDQIRARQERIPALSTRVETIDPWLERTIAHCLEYRPEDRPASIQEVSRELEG